MNNGIDAGSENQLRTMPPRQPGVLDQHDPPDRAASQIPQDRPERRLPGPTHDDDR